MNIDKILAWHVTPTDNLESILKNGLCPSCPEENGDLAISFFKTKEDALEQTKLWLFKKWAGKSLSILTVDITNLQLTETFDYELITTSPKVLEPSLILSYEKIDKFILANNLGASVKVKLFNDEDAQ